MHERAEDIVVEIDTQGVATVTIDRPAKRNALSLAMWRQLGKTFTELGKQLEARVIILTGAGGHFCAGADISEFGQVRNTPEVGVIYEAAVEGALQAIRDCPKATIAAVTGFGLGGGCGIALACDLRTGDSTTRMGIPAAKLGNVYGILECELLLRAVGLANAKLVLYAGRQFSIDDCVRMGLVNSAGASRAVETAREIAHELAANAPISIKGAKIILEALESHETDIRRHEIDAVIHEALASEDYAEAAKAFVAKRKPTFTGR